VEDLTARLLELGEYLVWYIGKSESDETLVVRVGTASKTPKFAELPRLSSVSETEAEALLKAGKLRVEWVE